jgi:hypothetical protein
LLSRQQEAQGHATECPRLANPSLEMCEISPRLAKAGQRILLHGLAKNLAGILGDLLLSS